MPRPGFALGTVAAARPGGGGSISGPIGMAHLGATSTMMSHTVTGGVTVPNFPSSGAKMDTLRDNFTDNSINAFYNDSSGGVSEASGVLTITVPDGGENYLGTLTTLDASASYLMVEAVSVNAGTGSYLAQMMEWTDTNNNAQMGYNGGNLNFTFRQGGVSSNYSGTTIPFNATNHRWWRILLAGTTMTFQTAPDGTTWSNPFGVTRTVSGTWYTATGPYLDVIGQVGAGGSVTFDNLNCPPGDPLGARSWADASGRNWADASGRSWAS